MRYHAGGRLGIKRLGAERGNKGTRFPLLSGVEKQGYFSCYDEGEKGIGHFSQDQNCQREILVL